MTAPATCPQIITSKAQWAACVPVEVAAIFWPRALRDKGQQWVFGQQQNLNRGTASIPSAYVFQLVPVVQVQAGILTIQDGKAVEVGGIYTEAKPKSLAEANMYYANELLADVPLSFARDLAAQIGVRQDIPEVQMRAGVAIIVAGVATKANELLPIAIDRARANAGATGSSFFGKFTAGLKKLVTHPGDWLQRVFITEPGKALQWAGRQLYSLSANQWTKWLIDPLGIFRQLGTFLEEIGGAMVAGKITEFDERRFAIENAKHWQQVGLVLAVAAPFLPPPFNIVALAVGALFTAAGTAIIYFYQQAATQKAGEARVDAAKAAAQQAQARADDAAAAAAYEAELAAADAAGWTRTALLAGDPNGRGKLLGLDAAPVALLVSAALLWGFYATR